MTTNKSMYDLAEDYRRLLAIAEDGIDEETGEVIGQHAVSAAFDYIRDNVKEKVVGVAQVIKRISAQEEEISDEVSRLQRRVNSLRMARESLKSRLISLMEATDTKKAMTPYVSVSLGKSSLSVVVDDVNVLPYSCKRVKIEPNKVEIKSMLDKGISVDGARLKPGKLRLTIR